MKKIGIIITSLALTLMISSCGNNNSQGNRGSNSGALSNESAATAVYVPPGEHDEYYEFFSGGFSGQVSVVGLPSGRLFRRIPVFSVDAEKGYGFDEETKPMLETSHGFIPWDDSHHPKLSQTNGEIDGRWLFINGNNTPRIARIDLRTFETVEIIEIPNSAGNHSSPYMTMNTEYLVSGTRFSIPIPQEDISIEEYKAKFRGTLSYISVDPESGDMNLAFQILMPGFDYDLATCGKGPSHGWTFFTTYNTEKGRTLKEATASQNDKDFIAAINWKKAEEYIAAGNYEEWDTDYCNNEFDQETMMATSHHGKKVKVLKAEDCPGMIYFLPTPKSPHGVDVNPTGEYIVGCGKLNADLTVHSFAKMLKAIENEDYETIVEGIPVLKYESVVAGVVKSGGLGPLHTEFDGAGNAYTSFFISSEIVKWKVGTWEVLDRVPSYYSVGHLSIPGGGSMKPWKKYLISMNKITKDRYLPTGPELAHSAQLYDISGDKMRLLLDFPTDGEPHYAQGCPAELIEPNSVKFTKLANNHHPYAIRSEEETRVERDGNEVHVYISSIRSHFAPDNIEGIKVGDVVYWHMTNLEQDWDTPHGFAIFGANTGETLVMPGATRTLKWEPKKPGVYPFYCTDFCSALHQEMQGYVRVSPAGSSTPLKWSLGED